MHSFGVRVVINAQDTFKVPCSGLMPLSSCNIVYGPSRCQFLWRREVLINTNKSFAAPPPCNPHSLGRVRQTWHWVSRFRRRTSSSDILPAAWPIDHVTRASEGRWTCRAGRSRGGGIVRTLSIGVVSGGRPDGSAVAQYSWPTSASVGVPYRAKLDLPASGHIARNPVPDPSRARRTRDPGVPGQGQPAGQAHGLGRWMVGSSPQPPLRARPASQASPKPPCAILPLTSAV